MVIQTPASKTVSFSSWALRHEPKFSSGACMSWVFRVSVFLAPKVCLVRGWWGLPLPSPEEPMRRAVRRECRSRRGAGRWMSARSWCCPCARVNTKCRWTPRGKLDASPAENSPLKSLWGLIYELLHKPTELQQMSNKKADWCLSWLYVEGAV